MKDFFDCALKLHQHGQLPGFERDYDQVEEARRLLQRTHIKATLDLDHLEKVFNALEMAEFLDYLGEGVDASVISTARESLIRLIVGVLERTQVFYKTTVSDGAEPTAKKNSRPAQAADRTVGPAGYDELALLINRLRTGGPKYSVSVITFNYDIGLEAALQERSLKFNYGIESNPETNQAIPVYKLHGSVNWFKRASRNDDDAGIEVLQIPRANTAHEGRILWPPTPPNHHGLFVRPSEQIDAAAGRYGQAAVPLIVPPSESKEGHSNQLRPIWRDAAKALSKADYLVAIGYSIPDTDEFFRQFYAVASIGEQFLRKFFVFDTNGSVKTKYAALIGRPILDRLHFAATTFENAVTQLYNSYRSNDGIL